MDRVACDISYQKSEPTIKTPPQTYIEHAGEVLGLILKTDSSSSDIRGFYRESKSCII